MFAVIYSFHVKSGQEKKFVKAWKELTKLIYKFENGLGSRLHKHTKQEYIAYAQWPDRITWANAGSNLPDKANNIRQNMKTSCETIKTVYELDVIDDLLKFN